MAGFLDAQAGATIVATSKGLFAYHQPSAVRLSNTARTPDATGSGLGAGSNARDWTVIDPGFSDVARQKAVVAEFVASLGLYTVVLQPPPRRSSSVVVAGALNARNAGDDATHSNAAAARSWARKSSTSASPSTRSVRP